MPLRRRLILGIVLLVVLGIHVGLFAAGGRWRTVGKVVLVVDVFSAWFLIAAIRENRKVEERGRTNK